MKKQILIIIGFLVLIISGCSMDEIPEKMIPKKADKYANEFLTDLLIKGDIDKCYDKFDNRIKNKKAKTFLINTNNNLAGKEIVNKRIIGSRWTTFHSGENTTNYQLDYEYQFKDFWAYFSFNIIEKENNFKILGFKGQEFENSLSKANEFTFKDKGFKRYVFLTIAILIVLFIITTEIFVIKSKIKKKWLWIIGVLIGLIGFQLNWTTGEIGVQLIHFKILGAGFSKTGIISPWILSFAIPVFAIAFWVKIFREKQEEIEKIRLQETIDKNKIEETNGNS